VHLNGFRRGVGVGAAFIFVILLSSSCLVRKRTVVPKGQPANKPALTASRDELLERIHKVADPIQSFSLKVDMSPSVGGVFGGQVTDYPTIQGVILFRRPEHIRVVGLDPVVHSSTSHSQLKASFLKEPTIPRRLRKTSWRICARSHF
jgi:hypothetical protein